MSKLEELIRELCPDGVEQKALGEVSTTISGFPFNSTQFSDNGIRLMRGMNIKRGFIDFSESITKYWKDDIGLEKYLLQENDIVIAMDGLVGKSYGFVCEEDLPCLLVQRVARVRTDFIDARYIYHYLTSEMFARYIDRKKTKGTIPHITLKDINEFKIDWPPIEIRQEIVRILDSFSELTTELTAELAAELAARKQQYECYRNELLTFNDGAIGITWSALGEICDVSAGGDVPKAAMSKEQTEDYNIPIVSNGVGENAIYGFTNIPKINTPSVTIAARGTIGYAEYRDYPYFPIIRLLSVSPKNTESLNTKYLYYVLQGRRYKIPESGIPQLTVPVLKKEIIAIPPVAAQKRIVNMLDKFNAICTDLNSGLPAEIEARQKQYEYYRDKLLDFKEISR